MSRNTTPSATEAGATGEPLLRVTELKKHFPVNEGFIASIEFGADGRLPLGFDDTAVKAVDGVSFELEPGETFGVVGESGCGKSTLARTVLGLTDPTGGSIEFDGERVDEFGRAELTAFRRRAQMVFQDPQSSLNPRRKVGHIISDPLEAAGWSESERRSRALELLEQVGLERAYYNRYPHEFSGGQRQRINLARALSINPDLVVADEPVSGLDVSVQAQILDLMDELQDEYGLTYLLISHDLSVVRYVADRVAVMYLGDFVEVAPTEDLFRTQYHPYAKALLSAVPNPDPDMPGVDARIEGDVPSATDPPRGCKFHTRCPSFILPDAFGDRGPYDAFVDLLEDVREGTADVGDGTGDETGGDGSDAVTVLVEYGASRERAERVEPPVRRAVADALRAYREGDRAAAAETLAAYESVCQRDVPRLERTPAAGQRAACHLDFFEDGDRE